MKKLMLLMAMLLAVTLSLIADTERVDGIVWTYKISDGKASVGGGSYSNTAVSRTTSGVLEIPSSLGGCPVVGINSFAFYSCGSLAGVTIPDSVTSIGNSAFTGCHSLTSFVVAADNSFYKSDSGLLLTKDGKTLVVGINGDVTIPDSVTSIGNSAFTGCSGLASVAIPNGVTNIGNSAFYACIGLTSVTIPDSVTSIGNDAFRNCSNLESVTILDSVTNIGALAFDGCRGLRDVAVPQYVCTNRMSSVFASACQSITNVVVSDGVTSIGDSAFAGCISMASVAIPDSVTNIVNTAFNGLGSLTSFVVASDNAFYKAVSGLLLNKDGKRLVAGINGDVTIPDGVTVIGSGSFSGCSGLTSVTIPNSVTNIGSGSFSGCSGLTSVTIPNSVTSIGNYVFEGCSSMALFMVAADNAFYKVVSGLLLTKDGKRLVAGINGDVTIPDCVTVIEDYAFHGRSGLTSVTIPDSVTSIGSLAFRECSSLTSVVIPTGVTRIGLSGFYGCSSLANVTISETVNSIGNYAFMSCSSLTGIIFKGDAPNVQALTFRNVSSECCVYVRRGSTGWGVEIPGTWQGVAIDYARLNMTFDANGGDCAVTNVCVIDGDTIGELPTPARQGYVFKGWWTAQEGGDEVTIDTVPDDDTTLFAQWEKLVVTIANPDSLVFYGDSCEVTLSCATEGAVIYYSPNGVTPRLTESFRYTGPFTITDTATIKAVAVLDGVKSEYMTATITKRTLSLGDAASANVTSAALPWTTGGDADWTPIVDATAASEFSVRSGVIGENAETWMQTVVSGAGTFSFSWKVDCEWDDSGDATWDHVVVTTNDVEAARMDGTTGWVPMSFEFSDVASHVIRWKFAKDDYDEPGESYADCAWVSGAVWTPVGTADPIPTVAVDADAATVNAAVDGVRFVDAAVKVAIGGSAAEYNKFKTWADGVKGVAGDALAGEAAVVANAHAAAAYLLGAERLFENEPTVEIGELAIVDGESAGTTAMTVAVTVKDGESAVVVDAAKVAAMFEATGDLGDWTGAAKLTPTVTTSGTGASGKMTFVVIPGDGTAAKAFLRIRK